jgi:hypothetical protein
VKGATTFTAAVQGGRIAWDNPAAISRFTKLLEGKRVEVQMRKFRKKRSTGQNAWYWGVLIPILGDHLGMDADELHDALKFKFLRVRVDEELETVRSSASLTTEEYSRYMENCQRLAAEYGCDVPFPNECAA